MRIFLRTASTYARACSETAQRIGGEVRPNIRVSTSHSGLVVERLREAAKETLAQIKDVAALIEARREIRQMIGQANHVTVHPLLTERDAINQEEKFLTALIEQFKGTAANRRYGLGIESSTLEQTNDVEKALDNLRQRLQTVTSGNLADYVDVYTLNKDEIRGLQDRVAQLRRRRTILNDELAAANLNAHIVLSPKVIKVLAQHKIIEESK